MPRLLIYSLRSLWARRTTSVSTALGIAFLVFVSCASSMLATGIADTNLTTNQEVNFRFQPEAGIAFIAASLALVVGLLGGALPSIRASRLDPVVLLRSGTR